MTKQDDSSSNTVIGCEEPTAAGGKHPRPRPLLTPLSPARATRSLTGTRLTPTTHTLDRQSQQVVSSKLTCGHEHVVDMEVSLVPVEEHLYTQHWLVSPRSASTRSRRQGICTETEKWTERKMTAEEGAAPTGDTRRGQKRTSGDTSVWTQPAVRDQ